MPDPREYPSEDLLGPLNEVERKYAPERLFVQGDVSLLHGTTRVSVVGTRRPSQPGLERSARLARELVEQDVVIVSGLALGIDRAAHASAIQAGGRTVAVIGTPLDRAYPRENADLQAEIARDHLLVSQFAPGEPTGKWVFPARNRTMALISHATVIVEAGSRSGCISQGWEALRLGRPLFLLRSLVDAPGLEWPAQLLDYGASVLDRTADLIDALPAQPPASAIDAF